MAYVLNRDTGLLEQVEQPTEAHDYPIVSPEGEFGSVPAGEYHSLIKQGFRAPNETELKRELDRDKYSSTGQQAISAVEGAADVATFGLASGIERAAGVSPEDMQGRREHAHGARVAGEMAGLAASALVPGGGALGIMAKAGEAAAQVATRAAAKAAVKSAAEFAMLTAGDEVSKAFAQDPDQTLESAAMAVGASALFGGAFGGAGKLAADNIMKPVFDATKGKAEEILSLLSSKAETAAIGEEAAKAGITLAPEMKAAMSGGVEAATAQGLRESATRAGIAYRDSLEALQKDVSDKAVEALGHTPRTVLRAGELSEYEEGKAAATALRQEVEAMYEPVRRQYEQINKVLPKVELSAEVKGAAADQIGRMALEDGFLALPGSDAARMVKKIIKGLGSVKDAEGLRQLQSGIREELASKQMWGLSKRVSSILRDAEERAIGEKLAFEAPEVLATHEAARRGYREIVSKLEDLSDRLRPGKWTGPEGFIKAVKEMNPEDIIRRLGRTNDAGALALLSEHFPIVASKVRQGLTDQLLKKAVNGARAVEGGIDTRRLFKDIDAMTPEMKAFLFGGQRGQQLAALQSIVEKLPERVNPSGTARAIDAIGSFSGGISGTIAALLTGDLGATAAFSLLGKAIGREVPDALRLAWLKRMGSDAPANAAAFRSLVDMVQAAQKGVKQTEKAVAALVKGGAKELVPAPSPARIERLRKVVDVASTDPATLLTDDEDGIGHYAPDQGIAKGALTSRVLQVLSSLKPQDLKRAPLDPPAAIDPVQKAQYEKALLLAEQPLSILNDVYNGTVTDRDVAIFKAMYPAQHNTLANKLTEAVIKHQSEGGKIAYELTLGLSTFIGMPLESSQLPLNRMMTQQALQLVQQGPAPQAPAAKPSQAGLKNLSKLPLSSATPQQSRELNKLSR
jgi:hypothetical protein